MNVRLIIDVLNELLTVEQRRLSIRLMEAKIFVSQLAIDDLRIVQRLADQSTEHCAWLVGAITKLGGVPGIRVADVTSADLHYQELRRVLPRMVSDHKALIEKYRIAAERVAADSEAAEVVGRILRRHQEDLEVLTEVSGDGVEAAG
jgi:hypothetical protein